MYNQYNEDAKPVIVWSFLGLLDCGRKVNFKIRENSIQNIIIPGKF